MCRFGMTSHVREQDEPRGLVKKPTGLMTSSRCIVAQLDSRCDGSHEHMHLVGGRASAAQVYPDELCRAILRGVVGQKAEDSRVDSIAVPAMSSSQIQGFISSLSNFEIGSVRELVKVTKPIGRWPDHIELLQSDLDALTMRNRIASAKDDVSGAELLPEWVAVARAEEMTYFRKLGVYRVVPRSHQ